MNTLSFNGEGNVLSFTQDGADLIIKDKNGITIYTLEDIFRDTFITTEQIQDIVGDMVSGNTETNISVTYNDTDAKLNFVSTDTNTTYSVQDGQLSQNNFTDADHTKLNGISTGAGTFFYDIKFANFSGSSTAHEFFIPFTNTTEVSSSGTLNAPSGASERCQFLAMCDGEIEEIKVRSEIEQNNIFGYEIQMELLEAGDSQEIVNRNDTKIGSTKTTSLTLADDTTKTFTMSDWILTEGRAYGIWMKWFAEPRDTTISILFKYTR